MAQDNTESKIIQGDTPIWGASAIAREIGLDRRHVSLAVAQPAAREARR
jgi:hypothetical protein